LKTLKSGKAAKPDETKPEAKEVKAKPKSEIKEPDYDFIREELEDLGHSKEYVELQLSKEKRAHERDVRDFEREQEREAEKARKLQEEAEAETARIRDNWTKLAESDDYKDFFAVPEDGELPEFKDPELEKEADALFEETAYISGYDDEGKPVMENPMLRSERGMRMFVEEVTRRHRANAKAKGRVDKEKSLKKKVVSNPSDTTKSSGPRPYRSPGEIYTELKRSGNYS
jgi:hypothetical protein